MGRRTRRLGETLKAELSDIIQRELKDPRIGFVTITGVDVSPDLRQARVFLSIMGDEKTREEGIAGLTQARGHIRSELGKRVRLKFLPELHFRIDPSIEEGLRISKLIARIKREEEPD